MRHQNFSDQPRKTVAITGSSGLVGSQLREFLLSGNHDIIRIVRSPKETTTPQIEWTPSKNEIDRDRLEGVDAVVHLAGENVFGYWSDDKKRRIMESRKKGTETISEAVASLDDPPDVFVSASAVGFYGDTQREWVDESSKSGDGFLAEVCREWENKTQMATDAGIRTVNLRIGIVLTKKGGALGTMLPAFKFGLGGPIGDGSQYMSWVSLDDLIGIIYTSLYRDALNGPVNAVSPNPVTNETFADTLGDVLSRPAFLSPPAFLVELLGGEMADEMLLSGQRVEPKKLKEINFDFHYPTLRKALERTLAD